MLNEPSNKMGFRRVLKVSISFKTASVFFLPAIPPPLGVVLLKRHKSRFRHNPFFLADTLQLASSFCLCLETKFATLCSKNKPFFLGELLPTNRCHCAVYDATIIDYRPYGVRLVSVHVRCTSTVQCTVRPLIDCPSDCCTSSSYFLMKKDHISLTTQLTVFKQSSIAIQLVNEEGCPLKRRP